MNVKPSCERLPDRILPSYTAGPETPLGAGYAPAVLPGGAAVWMQENGDDGWDVVGPAGTVAGGPDEQAFPSLTARPDGSYVLAWSGTDVSAPETWAVWVQAVDATFAAQGPAVRVDGGLAGYQPTPLVVVQPSGTVTVFYEGVWDGQQTPQMARDLDATLAPIGSPYGSARPTLPPAPVSVAVDTAGSVIADTPDGPYLVATGADRLYSPTVAVAGDGSFSVGWTAVDYGGAYLRTYTPDGQARAAQLPVTYTLDANGRVWSSLTQSLVTTDRVKQVLPGLAADGATVLYARGLNDYVYALRLDSTGHAAGSYQLTGGGQVAGLTATRLDDDTPALVALGLNGHQYRRDFDPSGLSGGAWQLL